MLSAKELNKWGLQYNSKKEYKKAAILFEAAMEKYYEGKSKFYEAPYFNYSCMISLLYGKKETDFD